MSPEYGITAKNCSKFDNDFDKFRFVTSDVACVAVKNVEAKCGIAIITELLGSGLKSKTETYCKIAKVMTSKK